MSIFSKTDKYGIVTRAFEGDKTKYQMSLTVGQLVFVKGEHGGWAKGSTYPETELRGYFPEDCVMYFDIEAVRKGRKIVVHPPGSAEANHHDDAHDQSYRTIRKKPAGPVEQRHLENIEFEKLAPKELLLSDNSKEGWWFHTLSYLPNAREVLDACHDWSQPLAELLKEENHAVYSKIIEVETRLMAELLMIPTFLKQQRKDKIDNVMRNQQKYVEEGNVTLGVDVVVRVKNGERAGEAADVNNTSVVKLYRGFWDAQKKADEMAVELKEKMMKAKQKQVAKTGTFFEKLKFGLREQDASEQEQQVDNDYFNLPEGNTQLVMDVTSSIFTIDEKMELYFFLYSAKNKKVISESFLLRLPPQKAGTSPDIKDLTDKLTKTIFKDIWAKDFTNNLWIVCQAFRRGLMIKDLVVKKPKDGVGITPTEHKRPFALGVFQLSPVVINTLVGGDEYTVSEPIQFFTSQKEENYSTLHEQLVESLSKGGKPKEQGLVEDIPLQQCRGVTLNLNLYTGSLDDSIAKEPELRNVCLTQIMSFPEVISPGDLRNDMYVTMYNGQIRMKANQKEPKNISVSARLVVDQETINCISPHVESLSTLSEQNASEEVSDSDVTPTSPIVQQDRDSLVREYISTVYYHVKNPTFNETFRLVIDPKQIEKAVLVFLFSNCPSRHASEIQPFGLSYWKLTNEKGLVPPEGGSTGTELTIYKYQKNLENEIDSFITQPALRSKLQTKSVFSISHKLVSTRVTQDEHLKNLLDWEAFKDNKKGKTEDVLGEILNKVLFMKTEEYKTLLREIFDALFSILSHQDNETLAGLVFKALNQTIGSLVSQKQLTEYCAILDKYIAHFFESTVAYKWIVHFIKDLVSDFKNIKKSKDLGETMKSLSYLFQIIVVSRRQFENAEMTKIRAMEGEQQEEARQRFFHDKDQFQEDILFIVRNLVTMMRLEIPTLILAQGNLVKFMSTFFDSVEHLLDSRTTGRVTRQFLEAIPLTDSKKNLIAGKLYTINMIVKGAVFKNDVARAIILPKIVSDLQLHMTRNETEKRICINIIQDMMNSMQSIITQAVLSGEMDDETAFLDLEYEEEIVDDPQPQPIAIATPTDVTEVEETVVDDNDGQVSQVEEEEEETQEEIHPRRTERPQQKLDDKIRLSVKDSVYKLYVLLAPLKKELDDLNSKTEEIEKSIEVLQEPPAENDTDPSGTKAKNAHEMKKQQQELENNRRLRADVICCITSFFHMFQEYETLEYHLTADELIAQGLSLKTLAELFSVQKTVVNHNCIPNNWITFINAMYACMLRLSTNIATYMNKYLLQEDTFDFQIWNSLFACIFHFVSSNDWHLEKMSSYKRKKLIQGDSFGDMRILSAQLFFNVWKEMDAFQAHFVPAIINPVMKVFDIPCDELQAVALDIYYNVLQHEYTMSSTLESCEGVTQRCVVEATVDDRFKANFINALETKFNADREMGSSGLELLKRLNDLIILVEEIQRFEDTEEDEKTSACIKVMNYFLSHGNLELYFTYAHTLSRMHANLKNYVEAASALKFHADHLSWDSEQFLPFFSDEYPEQPENERKENLFRKIIDLYDQGKDWERAIDCSAEIRNYLMKTFQYGKLEQMLQNEGRYYTCVWEKKRFFAEYFFVKFIGKGFASNTKYIYRGAELERNMDFINRLKKHFPKAEVSVKPLGPEYAEKEGQFIEVFTVFPSSQREFDNITPELHRKISPKIGRYQRLNNVRMFTNTRRFRESNDKTDNEYKDMHREITFYFVDQTFPNVQRRQPIVDEKVITLNPLLNAIKDIEDKNVDTFDCVVSHHIDKKPDTNELSMLLNGIIDAAVNGGIKKYLDAFFTKEYYAAHHDHGPLLSRFYTCLFRQIEILREGLVLRRKFVTGKALGLSEHLEKLFTKMEQMLQEIPVNDFPGVDLTVPSVELDSSAATIVSPAKKSNKRQPMA